MGFVWGVEGVRDPGRSEWRRPTEMLSTWLCVGFSAVVCCDASGAAGPPFSRVCPCGEAVGLGCLLCGVCGALVWEVMERSLLLVFVRCRARVLAEMRGECAGQLVAGRGGEVSAGVTAVRKGRSGKCGLQVGMGMAAVFFPGLLQAVGRDVGEGRFTVVLPLLLCQNSTGVVVPESSPGCCVGL